MHLDYNKAKELKDVGFPQEFKLGKYFCSHKEELDGKHDCDDIVYCPTLDELIKECGYTYFSMEEQSNDTVKGAPFYAKKRDVDIMAEGKTPLEAVANLYIALNESKR